MAESSSPTAPSGLWQVPLFLCGLLAIGGAWAVHVWWYDPQAQQIERALAQAREQLRVPDGVTQEKVTQLELALRNMTRFPERRGEALFLLGSSCIKLAEQLDGDRATDMWAKARAHLEEARGLEIEPEDKPRLAYRLAKTLCYLGDDPHQVAEKLVQSIEKGADDRAEGYALLTQVFLRMVPPELQAALDANAKLVQLPAADENLLAPARLLRGELLLRLRDREGARKILTRIGPGAAPELQTRAHYLLARSFQEDGSWGEAASLWENILADRGAQSSDRGRIQFWLGKCYRNLGRSTDAEHAWTQALAGDGAASQAAALCLAQLRLERDDLNAAMVLFGKALAEVKKPEDYRNSFLNLDEAQALLLGSCLRLLEGGHFERATQLAEICAHLGPASQVDLLRGQVAEAWAVALHRASENRKDQQTAAREARAAHQQFLIAGSAFESVAETTKSTAKNADVLLRAADDYRQAGEPARVVAVLERYLKLQPAADHLGEAWYRLGEAHLELHNDKLAEGSFSRCIEQTGRFAYLARYQLAQHEIRRGTLVKAEEILRQNFALLKETDGEAYEKTLYSLGFVLYRNEKYSLAAQRLDLALKLYPANSGAAQARFQLAECYRHLAEAEQLVPGPEGALAPDLQHVHRQHIHWLDMAAANYQKLVDDLEAQRAGARLNESERLLWRDAFFALAKCRSDEGFWEEAGRLYESLSGLFQHEYHGLIAFRQLYLTYVLLTAVNPDYVFKARATIQRALQALDELEETVFKGRPEIENRAAWEKLFRRAADELRKDGSAETGR